MSFSGVPNLAALSTADRTLWITDCPESHSLYAEPAERA